MARLMYEVTPSYAAKSLCSSRRPRGNLINLMYGFYGAAGTGTWFSPVVFKVLYVFLYLTTAL